jgi:hypothetical protein
MPEKSGKHPIQITKYFSFDPQNASAHDWENLCRMDKSSFVYIEIDKRVEAGEDYDSVVDDIVSRGLAELTSEGWIKVL